jgi:hypothetical protein
VVSAKVCHLGATWELDACRWLVHNEKVYPIHISSSILYGALIWGLAQSPSTYSVLWDPRTRDILF